MALSRPLSNIHKHISSTTNTTVMTAFRHQIHRNNFSAADFEEFHKKCEYNGYQTIGYPGPHLTLHTDNAFVFRLDVPGIRPSDLRYTTHGSKFSFTAQESIPHRFGLGRCVPRYYEAEIEVDPLVYQSGRFTAEVNNGLLTVLFPKILTGPGSPHRGWICLNFAKYQINLDAEGNHTTVYP